MDKQEPSVEKSLQIIEELIAVSLYCISYLRNLFSEKNYASGKYYDTATPTSSSNYISTKKLIRGVSKHGDLFINYIEQGIFQAIELQYLKGISFNIHNDTDNPFEVSESYLFGIDYGNSSVSFNDGSEITVYDKITQNIQGIIKRLIIMTQSLDLVSEKRFFTIRLLFNDTCPADYQPPYFQDASYLEPNVIKIEADSQGLEIGNLDTGRDQVKVHMLIEKKNSVNVVSIDPLDLLAEGRNYFEEIPASSLHLGEYLETCEDLTPTQIVSIHSDETNCKKCGTPIDPVAYGYDKPIWKPITCYGCLFDSKLDPGLVLLVNIRKMWNYYMHNDEFPSFEKISDIIGTTDEVMIKEVFNKFFSNNILITTTQAMFSTNSIEFISGCGEFIPNIDGIIANDGSELRKNKQYFIGFVPKLSQKLPFFSYDKTLDSIFFPNFKVQRINFVLNNLKKFKNFGLTQDDYFKKRESYSKIDNDPKKPSGSIYSSSSKLSSTIEEQSDDSSATTIDEPFTQDVSTTFENLSFSDSLKFLSQSQQPEKKKKKVQLQKTYSKKRKISINKEY
ncbi:HOP1 Meiosis-specific protein HOP1 [Candida maltosa Xu316]